MPTTAFPPGPARSLRTLMIYGPGRDPLAFFVNLARTYGDIAYVHTATERMFLLNHPQLVKDVLVTNQRNFRIVNEHGSVRGDCSNKSSSH